MFSTRNQITEYIQQGDITADRIDAALRVSGVTPDTSSWRLFIERLLLWAGGLSVALAAVFFIAYNWVDLGRFAKFGLVQLLIVLATAAYWMLGTEKPAAKLALLMACIFVGVLLALYGQTYQTGADPWQLFFSWALLMLPWTILGRFAPIWVLWLFLLNLAILLYHYSFRSFFWLMVDSETELLWAVFAFNTLSLVIWEVMSKYCSWLSTNWAERLLATVSGVAITWLVMENIFNDNNTNFSSTLVWLAWLAALYFFYRKIKPDLFMLTGVCTSGISIIVTFSTYQLIDSADEGGLLFIALLLIGLGTGATLWLRNIHREIQS